MFFLILIITIVTGWVRCVVIVVLKTLTSITYIVTSCKRRAGFPIKHRYNKKTVDMTCQVTWMCLAFSHFQAGFQAFLFIR